MTTSNTATTSTVTVTFRKQGGAWMTGTVTGRKGKQLLISYMIANGEDRERWIPASRYEADSIQGDLETVPRYKSQTCKATKFDQPILLYSTDGRSSFVCESCGESHNLVLRTEKKRIEMTREEGDAYIAESESEYADGRILADKLDGSGATIHSRCYRGDRSEFSEQEYRVETTQWIDGLSSRKLTDVLAS